MRDHPVAELENRFATLDRRPRHGRGITFGCTLPSEMWPHTARSRSRSANSRRHSCIMSPKRSNGTIMSAAVFEIAASACRARATRRLTPAGTASRSSANAAARDAIAGRRDLGIVEHAEPLKDAAETHERRVRRGRIAHRFEPLQPGAVRGVRQLEIDQQRDRRSRRQRDIELAIDAVFANHGNRSRVDVFDGGDVDATRIAGTPGLDRGARAVLPSSRLRGPPTGQAQWRGTSSPGQRRGAEGHAGNDAERAFGTYEEIDQIHVRRDEITGRSLRHIRHANVTGSLMLRSPEIVPMVKPPSVARCSPRHNSSTSPPASTTVRPSTHSRTVPYLNVAAPAAQVATAPPAKAPRYVGTGGNQRPDFASSSCSTCKRDAGADADAITRDADGVETIGAEDDVAERRGAAGQRRLRADHQHAPRLAKARRRFLDRSRPQHAGGAVRPG